MSKIKIGQLGTYHDHAAGMCECVKRFSDVFEFVGVVAESKEREEEVLKNQSWYYEGVKFITEEELFDSKPDAVMVEGDEKALLKLAEKCIDKNIHVHVDKPAGEDLSHLRKILDKAKEKNLVFQMSYMYRYNDAIKKTKEIVKSGKLGDIIGIDAVMNTEHPADKRKWLSRFKGGIMFFLGCHMVDLVYMFGGYPKEVYALNKVSGLDGNEESEDNCFAMLDYGSFTASIRMSSCEVNGYGRRQLVVSGTKGTVEIKPLEGPTEMYVSYKDMTDGNLFSNIREKVEIKQFVGRYDEMMLDFAKMVAGEKTNEYDYEYEYNVQRLLLEICNK